MDNLKKNLIELTRQIRLKTNEPSGFDNEDVYGINFENDVFKIHPYCWCERDDCGYCQGDEPNFIYKPNGSMVYWYKCIGRSQVEKGSLPAGWLKNCISSLWDENDCWFEFGGEKNEPIDFKFCFNILDNDSVVEGCLATNCANNYLYWGLEDVIGEFDYCKDDPLYKKMVELDKKYPALRKKIKQWAIKNIKETINCYKNRIKTLEVERKGELNEKYD